jgi:hypothetical protein
MTSQDEEALPGGLVAVPDDLTVEMPGEGLPVITWWETGPAERLLADQLRQLEDARLLELVTKTALPQGWYAGTITGGVQVAPLVSFTCAQDVSPVFDLGSPRQHFVAGKTVLKGKKK